LNIAVVGTGYVGLVTGTCFAETGNNVICVDIDAGKVEKMKKGIVPIYEPGLETLFERNIKKNRLEFTTDLHDAVGVPKLYSCRFLLRRGEMVLLTCSMLSVLQMILVKCSVQNPI